MAKGKTQDSKTQNSNIKDSKTKDKVVYREFSSTESSSDIPTDEQEAKSPAQQNLKIQLSRKGRNGKTVTVVMGFDLSLPILTDLLKQLKNQCGTGGSLNQEADPQLEIQGDHRQKILEILVKQGYKAKII
jgi:translation initiation factor 1